MANATATTAQRETKLVVHCTYGKGFSPDHLVVHVGSTVTFSFSYPTRLHVKPDTDVTMLKWIDNNKGDGSGSDEGHELKPGKDYIRKFDKTGLFQYYCGNLIFMRGEIRVIKGPRTHHQEITTTVLPPPTLIRFGSFDGGGNDSEVEDGDTMHHNNDTASTAASSLSSSSSTTTTPQNDADRGSSTTHIRFGSFEIIDSNGGGGGNRTIMPVPRVVAAEVENTTTFNEFNHVAALDFMKIRWQETWQEAIWL